MESVVIEDTELVAARNALRDSDARFRTLADAMPQMVWSSLPDGFHDYYNSRWYEFTGAPAGSTDGEGWNDMFHPDDREKAWTRWRHSLETGEPYEVEYRLRHRSGEYRWTLGRAQAMRDADGQIVRWMGTCTDIDQAKRNAEHNEILGRELSHRIKNIFAVVNGLIGFSARVHPEMGRFAGDLKERIAALGRAHDFVRPHSEQSRPIGVPETLQGVLREILSPYPALDQGHIRIRGDDSLIDDRAATPVALLIHELATNAVKYGALSTPDGEVTVTIGINGQLVDISWVEHGGPKIEQTPGHTGFGTRLADISIKDQLGGTIDRRWERDGLAVSIAVATDRLLRRDEG